jgi:hypothetical protein
VLVGWLVDWLINPTPPKGAVKVDYDERLVDSAWQLSAIFFERVRVAQKKKCISVGFLLKGKTRPAGSTESTWLCINNNRNLLCERAFIYGIYLI